MANIISKFKNLNSTDFKIGDSALKKKFNRLLKEIEFDLNKKRNVFQTFNKDYKINTKILNKFKKFKFIIIIGMGGSTLGAEAIYSFLKSKIKKDIYFLNNLEINKLKEISNKKIINKSLFIIISKSGETLETLSLVNSFQKGVFRQSNSIIITENKKNSLKLFAEERKILVIDHKRYIGGRYSVLSEVGMIPAFLMGLKVNDFKKKILKFLKNNSSLLRQNVLDLSKINLTKNYRSVVFLSYSPELNEFANWCQQLISESLGKKGKGLMPILSVAPRDHHSMLQLYLDGPKDKVFYILSLEKSDNRLIKNLFKKKDKIFRKKGINKIILAQKNALIQNFNDLKIPYREITLKNIKESSIGEIFSYFIVETFLVGKLMNINPFDQPAVEKVKQITQNKLLKY